MSDTLQMIDDVISTREQLIKNAFQSLDTASAGDKIMIEAAIEHLEQSIKNLKEHREFLASLE